MLGFKLLTGPNFNTKHFRHNVNSNFLIWRWLDFFIGDDFQDRTVGSHHKGRNGLEPRLLVFVEDDLGPLGLEAQ